MWHRTKTVYHTLTELIYVFITLQTIQLTIQEHSLAAGRHILFAERHRKIALYDAFLHKVRSAGDIACLYFFLIQVLELIVTQFLDCLRENLLVSLVTQIGDETALFGSQKVSCTTNIQVLHGYVNATTQVGEILYGLQTAAGIDVQGT